MHNQEEKLRSRKEADAGGRVEQKEEREQEQERQPDEQATAAGVKVEGGRVLDVAAEPEQTGVDVDEDISNLEKEMKTESANPFTDTPAIDAPAIDAPAIDAPTTAIRKKGKRAFGAGAGGDWF
jgi:hypothetical protein